LKLVNAQPENRSQEHGALHIAVKAFRARGAAELGRGLTMWTWTNSERCICKIKEFVVRIAIPGEIAPDVWAVNVPAVFDHQVAVRVQFLEPCPHLPEQGNIAVI